MPKERIAPMRQHLHADAMMFLTQVAIEWRLKLAMELGEIDSDEAMQMIKPITAARTDELEKIIASLNECTRPVICY